MSKQRQPAARSGLDQASAIPVVPLVTLITLVMAYWIAFYATVPLRLQYLATLVLPDQVWDDWTASEGRPHFLDRLPIWLLVTYYLAVAWAAGRLALRWLRPAGLTALEQFVFALSLGLGLLSTATLLIGLAGGLGQVWLFRVGTALILLTEVLWVIRAGQAKTVGEARMDRSSVWLGCLFGVFVFIYALAATLPPTDFDVCEYHLQVPKEWFLAARIDFLPHNVYGNMPLGAEMHALACMELWPGNDAWWYGALAGKVVMALFAPLTALALYTAGLRWFSQPAGVIAAALYLTFPWIAHVSFNGLNDGVLAHYVFVAMYAAMLAGVDWRTQLLAGLLAGCAAACKYPGLIFVALPVVLIVVLRAKG